MTLHGQKHKTELGRDYPRTFSVSPYAADDGVNVR